MKTKSLHISLVLLASSLVLAGCGGGGGGGNSGGSTQTVPNPVVTVSSSSSSSSVAPPTLTFTTSNNKVKVGDSVTLTWESTGADSCSVLSDTNIPETPFNLLSGTIKNSDNTTVTIPHFGQHSATITCKNTGGNVSKSVAVAAPQELQKTSLENRAYITALIGSQSLPMKLDTSLPYATTHRNQEVISNSFTFADFKQNGSTILFAASETDHLDGIWSPDAPSKIYFFEKTANGWNDITSTMVSDNTGCILPRRALVADFNNDGFPDVFMGCHGLDGSPYPGENQRVILSNGDGTYKNIEIAGTIGFDHGATAVDMNGDGLVDIVVADMNRAWDKGTPVYVLANQGNGVFVPNYDLTKNLGLRGKNFWTVEAFMLNGKMNLAMGGSEGSATTETNGRMVEIDPTGTYANVKLIDLPASTTVNHSVLDYVVDGNSLYVNRTGATATTSSLQKVDMLTNTTVWEKDDSVNNTWIDFISIFNGKIVSLNKLFGLSITE